MPLRVLVNHAVWTETQIRERIEKGSRGGKFQMCDYSLFAIPNRLAKEQEDLVAHRFPTGSMGLASPADLRRNAELRQRKSDRSWWSAIKGFFTIPKTEPVPAVCIPPGARLQLQDIPVRLQQELAVGPCEAVVFTQISAATNTYRDAVRF